ncbi:MAG: hypothetical protein EOP09_02355 [Proteobacteria bacterium]|nr:MAG: hypothetical protein EOP09_02355 [Pseudomonadota bacterium]
MMLFCSNTAGAGMIIGSGMEDQDTHEKIHLVASEFDEAGNPRYVQFQYTDPQGLIHPVGSSVLVFGEIRHFIRSYAVLHALAKDPQKRRTFQVTRAVYGKTNVRLHDTGTSGALTLVGGLGGMTFTRQLIKPQSGLGTVGSILLGFFASPIIIDVALLPYTLMADALDSTLKFPFSADLEPLDSTARENWMLRSEKFSHPTFQNFLTKLRQIPNQPAFERRALSPITQASDCALETGSLALDLGIPLKATPIIDDTDETRQTKDRNFSNSLMHSFKRMIQLPVLERSDYEKYDQLMSDAQALVEKLASQGTFITYDEAKRRVIAAQAKIKTTWKMHVGIFRQSRDGLPFMCMAAVFDSEFAPSPLTEEVCARLSKKKMTNTSTLVSLTDALYRKLDQKKLACDNGQIFFTKRTQ